MINNPSKDKDNEGIGYNVKGAKKYKLKESHPGYKFSHLTELKHPTIPKISLPRDKLCPIEELDLHSKNPNEIFDCSTCCFGGDHEVAFDLNRQIFALFELFCLHNNL